MRARRLNRRTVRQFLGLASFAGTFAILGLAAHIWWTRGDHGLRPMDIAAAEPPAVRDSYYLASDKGGHVDHHVLYHGTDAGVVEYLRTSDVLLLGSSRLLFALTRQDLRSFFPRHGLTYYMLAFGHREHDAFPRAIIERFDLRPKLVIVNADGFFAGDQSPWAERVVSDSRFDALKLWFEAEAAHAVRRRLHDWWPHLPDVLRGEREFIAYRSRIDGTWIVATSFAGLGAPMVPPSSDPVVRNPKRLVTAREFKAEVEARGGRLVLCQVPAPGISRASAEWLASELGVPLVAPRLDDLSTVDGSHLTRDSAARFARAFFDELEPVVRALGLSRAQAAQD
jgi:hypothetical protein